MEMQIGPLRYSVRRGEDWLEVDYTGQVADLSIAQQWMTALDLELQRSQVEKILWDSRGAEPHPSEVRTSIWEWLKAARYLKVSAILVESKLLRVTANMSAVSSNIPVKSFHSRVEAAEWLRAQAT
ncbi:MAG: hypothetical protein AAFU77_06705 [Myxococcota bacterium]